MSSEPEVKQARIRQSEPEYVILFVLLIIEWLILCGKWKAEREAETNNSVLPVLLNNRIIDWVMNKSR